VIGLASFNRFRYLERIKIAWKGVSMDYRIEMIVRAPDGSRAVFAEYSKRRTNIYFTPAPLFCLLETEDDDGDEQRFVVPMICDGMNGMIPATDADGYLGWQDPNEEEDKPYWLEKAAERLAAEEEEEEDGDGDEEDGDEEDGDEEDGDEEDGDEEDGDEEDGDEEDGDEDDGDEEDDDEEDDDEEDDDEEDEDDDEEDEDDLDEPPDPDSEDEDDEPRGRTRGRGRRG
jgi:hypothetical protein